MRVVSYFKNKQIARDVEYNNNKKNGTYQAWYTNGTKLYQSNYKDDKKDGEFLGWYPNGQQRFLKNYKNNIKNGVWIEWDEKGNEKSKVFYCNNKIYNRLNEIVLIQRWFKRVRIAKKIYNLANNQMFIQLYWHPDAKGGYFHILNMSKLYQKYFTYTC
jgi:hypothetical protein